MIITKGYAQTKAAEPKTNKKKHHTAKYKTMMVHRYLKRPQQRHTPKGKRYSVFQYYILQLYLQ